MAATITRKKKKKKKNHNHQNQPTTAAESTIKSQPPKQKKKKTNQNRDRHHHRFAHHQLTHPPPLICPSPSQPTHCRTGYQITAKKKKPQKQRSAWVLLEREVVTWSKGRESKEMVEQGSERESRYWSVKMKRYFNRDERES